jgi:hypothetical protein
MSKRLPIETRALLHRLTNPPKAALFVEQSGGGSLLKKMSPT